MCFMFVSIPVSYMALGSVSIFVAHSVPFVLLVSYACCDFSPICHACS